VGSAETKSRYDLREVLDTSCLTHQPRWTSPMNVKAASGLCWGSTR
jgi:hypothetical protein